MKLLLHIIFISLAQRLFAYPTLQELYHHLYPAELVNKIYDYTPLITDGPIIEICTTNAQTLASNAFPNWDTTCTVVENDLLDRLMKFIDSDFEINNLVGSAIGIFKRLRSRNHPENSNSPVESLSPLLNYTGNIYMYMCVCV
eukprot:GHVR01063324.1.p1 GENE.GHVR01063324.1~~GHVR01063324.1.p1  ORF type:complete len:143 (+),score=15.94 GHVR01063324.1:73-501(+)